MLERRILHGVVERQVLETEEAPLLGTARHIGVVPAQADLEGRLAREIARRAAAAFHADPDVVERLILEAQRAAVVGAPEDGASPGRDGLGVDRVPTLRRDREIDPVHARRVEEMAAAVVGAEDAVRPPRAPRVARAARVLHPRAHRIVGPVAQARAVAAVELAVGEGGLVRRAGSVRCVCQTRWSRSPPSMVQIRGQPRPAYRRDRSAKADVPTTSPAATTSMRPAPARDRRRGGRLVLGPRDAGLVGGTVYRRIAAVVPGDDGAAREQQSDRDPPHRREAYPTTAFTPRREAQE